MRTLEPLDALRLADRRITELCKMVCTLARNPRKVRPDDFAEEIRATIKKMEAAPNVVTPELLTAAKDALAFMRELVISHGIGDVATEHALRDSIAKIESTTP